MLRPSTKGPLRRHPENPILCPGDMPFRCYSVFNSGAALVDGKVLLLLRVESCERRSDFYVATSDDGVHFDVSPEPIDYPLTETEKRYDAAHRFDMRITRLEGTWHVTHAAWMGRWGCCMGMATTDDFVHFKPLGDLSVPSNRNHILFPERIGGLYCRLERPQHINGKGETWVSYSPDLEYWGRSMPLNMPALKWGGNKNGGGAVPIRTDHGWLAIYHATASTCSTENYYLGAMLLDLDDPSRVIAAPTEFILAAEEVYECVGQTPNVVFTNGAVEMPDGALNIYYGCADTRMALAQTTVATLVDFCLAAKG